MFSPALTRTCLAAGVLTAGLAVAWATATPKPAVADAPEDAPAYADPSSDAMNQTAPDVFDAVFTIANGDERSTFVVRATREWAPIGADRFYNLVKSGYFNDQRVFRVVPNFVAQFGIHGDPDISARWRSAEINDDPVRPDVQNTRGRIVFANRGPDTRTTQLFINFQNNANLDVRQRNSSVFTPFGEVIEGMDAVDNINAQYGQRPNQAAIQSHGNGYLDDAFPKLTEIVSAEIVEAD